MQILQKNQLINFDPEIQSIISYLTKKWDFGASDIYTIVQESYDLGRKSAGNLYSSYAFDDFARSIQISKKSIPHPHKKYFNMCLFDFDGPFLFCDAITGSSETVREIFSNQSIQSRESSLKNLYSTISPLFSQPPPTDST